VAAVPGPWSSGRRYQHSRGLNLQDGAAGEEEPDLPEQSWPSSGHLVSLAWAGDGSGTRSNHQQNHR
jgi:hypothetical protein